MLTTDVDCIIGIYKMATTNNPILCLLFNKILHTHATNSYKKYIRGVFWLILGGKLS